MKYHIIKSRILKQKKRQETKTGNTKKYPQFGPYKKSIIIRRQIHGVQELKTKYNNLLN